MIVDYFSRWIEIIHLLETTSLFVIGKLKNLFAKFGIPEVVVSDDGPQFSSANFLQFSQEYSFNIILLTLTFLKRMGVLREQFRLLNVS